MTIESIWETIPLSKFGYKCIANRHELCRHKGCLCICHRFEQELSEY